MLDFVMKHTTKGECPLAGNTIYMDKIFLMKYMPRFVDHLHYRLVDVSTVKELARYVRMQCFLASYVHTYVRMNEICQLLMHCAI